MKYCNPVSLKKKRLYSNFIYILTLFIPTWPIQMTVYCTIPYQLYNGFNSNNIGKCHKKFAFYCSFRYFSFDICCCFSLTKPEETKRRKFVSTSKLFPSLMILFCRLKRSNFILEIYLKEADHPTIYWCELLFHVLINIDRQMDR